LRWIEEKQQENSSTKKNLLTKGNRENLGGGGFYHLIRWFLHPGIGARLVCLLRPIGSSFPGCFAHNQIFAVLRVGASSGPAHRGGGIARFLAPSRSAGSNPENVE
jgi:hypothetical protein